ncbi:hypothetical protein LTR84_004924 [Exophiala bonariae]|uniref:Hyaluronan/mRNA-binding protein domain-containing protein n=1 Tax=Exophiala bonariae TaxID=1690606 RepID=A0AAV9NR03_9EURO|nr:hypothetical protein LTR84_004924 [Exophiala bonariae]
MADVKSKNLYELLGNTSDQDSDREPEPPTKTIEKPTARLGKRDAPASAPADSGVSSRGGRGGRRGGGFSGSEAAYRNRTTGRNYNRDQGTGEKTEDGNRGARRGGRGSGGPRRGGDRHSRTDRADHEKQVGHGWGENTGEGEWADEKAGEAIASQEVKEGGWDANAEAPAATSGGDALPEQEPEPEDNSKSYADYLAEQASKKLSDLGLKEARAPNEGSKENKKWKSGKEITKEEDEDYFKGEEKAKRERAREPKKEFLDIDYSFKEQARDSRGGGRGGRGRGRGEFRGGDRGDRSERPERSERPDRGDRGDFRGRGRGRGERGEYRGRGGRGRGGNEASGSQVAVDDTTAFPSLGGK